MKKILSFVLAMVCLLALAGCGGGAKKTDAPAPKAPAEKVLRVGTDADYPPFEYYQEASKTFIGFDIGLMQGLATEMGYSKVEFVDLEFNNLLPSLKDGQVDAVISCMNITDERRKMAAFTEPYLKSYNVVIAAAGTEARSADAMRGKRIAAEIGSIHEKQAKKYSDAVIESGGAEEAIKLILADKADFAIMDHFTALFYMNNFHNGKLAIVAALPGETDTDIAIAVAKGNKELLDRLNAALGKYRENAAYHQLKTTYFGKLK
ncbi:MAG: transporter substrate-binding domain-containing protein [Acidaminococcaceae bacterium]|nr:transporter substrate-binding domain-containing protein [Acidaminococcaceae bacterium]